MPADRQDLLVNVLTPKRQWYTWSVLFSVAGLKELKRAVTIITTVALLKLAFRSGTGSPRAPCRPKPQLWMNA
jgi:hypothetical protein